MLTARLRMSTWLGGVHHHARDRILGVVRVRVVTILGVYSRILVLSSSMRRHGRGGGSLTVRRRTRRLLSLVERGRRGRVWAAVQRVLGVHGGVDRSSGTRRSRVRLKVSSEAGGGRGRLIANVRNAGAWGEMEEDDGEFVRGA